MSRVILAPDDFEYLSDLCRELLEACRVRPGERIGNVGPNATGHMLIRPGARDSYPAFYLRDFVLAVDCGLITSAELRYALLLTARRQQPRDWQVPSGSWVLRGCVPDHITLAGAPIFFPGTLDNEDEQGGAWGVLPPFDNHFYFVLLAWQYWRTCNSTDFLMASQPCGTLIDGLELAFDQPPARGDSELVVCDDDTRGAATGFTDAVYFSGDLLMPSLLKLRAARALAALCKALGDPAKRAAYQEIADRIRAALVPAFQLPGGLLRAATGASSQPDVWGTAYAVYLSALPPEAEHAACTALAAAVSGGSVVWHGHVRQVPVDADATAESAWERLVVPPDHPRARAVNGGYWGVPVGWVLAALAKFDEDLAQELAAEFLTELRANDFRLAPDMGAPYETIQPEGELHSNPLYLASISCPLAVVQTLAGIRMGGPG